MMPFISREELQSLREKYKPGTRVELLHMDDVQAPPPGTRGTVRGVDDAGDLLITWDTGSTLKLIIGVDDFRVVDDYD